MNSLNVLVVIAMVILTVKLLLMRSSGVEEAEEIAQELDITHIELDELHWMPGWKERETEVFYHIVEEKIRIESWVMDGNYSKIYNALDISPDHIVWLDYPLLTVLWRCTKRTFVRIFCRKSVCNGNVETLRTMFSSDNLHLWILKTYRWGRRSLKEFIDKGIKVNIIKHKRDIERLIDELKNEPECCGHKTGL